MSEKIVGTGIRRIVGGMVTDRGHHGLFKLEQENGKELVIAIPAHQLDQLVLLAAQCASESRRKQQADPRMKPAFPVEHWYLAQQVKGDQVVLNLILDREAEISFAMPKGFQQRMIDGLANTLAAPPEPAGDADKLN